MKKAKVQSSLSAQERVALRKAAALCRRSIGDLIREAIRKELPNVTAQGLVALWDGALGLASTDHDCIHDQAWATTGLVRGSVLS